MEGRIWRRLSGVMTSYLLFFNMQATANPDRRDNPRTMHEIKVFLYSGHKL